MDSPSESLPYTAVELNSFFSKPCVFTTGCASVAGLPPAGLPEVAFVGRSNVGKSSIINALTNRRSLARTSGTPGCTQQLNFFTLAERLYLVDMPGYGYAKASKKEVKGWNYLILDYLRGRANLHRLFLLIDSRRGVLESDEEIMTLLDEHAVNYQLVLTKADKLSQEERKSLISATKAAISLHVAAHPELIITSAHKTQGIDDLRAAIYSFVGT